MSDLTGLLTSRGRPESPRWHEGRLSALMLGGPDRRTPFIVTVAWRPAGGHVANLDRLANGPRTAEILTLPVSGPGAGRP
jgi:hypothetical protein